MRTACSRSFATRSHSGKRDPEHGWRAVELLPGSPQLRYNLALSTLRLDDYPARFAMMEARIDKPWIALAIAPSRAAERHRLLQPGEPVDGRHILPSPLAAIAHELGSLSIKY
jgi:hypothetical protein